MTLENTRATLKLLREHTDSVLVGFSGGKDSCTVLDLCCSIFPHVEAMFWYLVKGLQCEEIFLRFAENRYKVPIHRVPSHLGMQALKSGNFTPLYFGMERLPTVKQIDTENALRRRTGITWIAYGMRMSDSIERRAMLKNIAGLNTTAAGLDEKAHRVYPIYDWAPKDVHAYLRQRRIPLPNPLGGHNSGAVTIAREVVPILRANYPEDLERIFKIFPFWKAEILKHEQEEREKEAVTLAADTPSDPSDLAAEND